MRALVLHSAGDARVEERDEPPAPRPNEVTLSILRSGLCGTDASEFLAGPVLTPLTRAHPVTGFRGPIVLGHEFTGEVIEVGSGTDGFSVGDRVAAGAGMWCGDCAWCARGQTNLCARYWTFGLSTDGGLTERLTVPTRMLHHIPETVSDDNAGLAQPLAVGLHAVDRSGLQAGDVVVVHGAGAIGSFVIAGAVAKRAAVIIAVDVDDNRLSGATELGATHTVNALQHDLGEVVRELTGGDLADVTIETSGIPDGMSRLQSVTRRGGTLQLVGLPKKPVSFNAVDLTLREIDVKTTVAHVCDTDLPHALQLLEEQDLSGLLVDRVVPLEDAVDGALVPLAEGRASGKLLVATTVGSS